MCICSSLQCICLDPALSSPAQEVQAALEELGLDSETEYSADSLEYSVDLALPEQRIAIEVHRLHAFISWVARNCTTSLIGIA